MPQVGETQRGRAIGKGNGDNYIWYACEDCGVERWILIKNGRVRNKRCRKCASRTLERRATSGRANRGKTCEKNHNWKGGKTIIGRGYVGIKLSPDSFFYSMARKSGYVQEHRLVMARHLGRCLHSWEIVHHKNHNRSDNRLENLHLLTDAGHRQVTFLEERIRQLENRVTMLEAENILLKSYV